MSLIETFKRICLETDASAIDRYNDRAKIVAAYAFYHYYNGDTTQFDECVTSTMVETFKSTLVSGIFKSANIDGDAIDFLYGVTESEYTTDSEFYRLLANQLVEKVGRIVTKQSDVHPYALKILDELAPCIIESSSAFYTIRLICDFNLNPVEKIKLQGFFSSITTTASNVSFELYFRDDVEQEINDVESPKDSVRSGSLCFYGSNGVCPIGTDGSFMCVISARSLRALFLRYSTSGLFASNLRFFISSKKIDPKIIETINGESENFVYYNNGIIVTCEDCKIVDSRVDLTNFSIVNGGQTTNLIGRSSFDNDFGVVCKVVICNDPDPAKRAEFLSKVAEASNTQKPINAKDLIANRTEQRLLKSQYAGFNVFLKVKRGEKINKSIYSEPWQNASNEEVAQIIYSAVYQRPGDAKNSKSKLLSTDTSYDAIFKTKYTDNFLLSLQYLKSAYSKWKTYTIKTRNRADVVAGLSRRADLMAFGVIGFVVKCFTNNVLYKKLCSLDPRDFRSDNDDLKYLLFQNDIGKGNLLTENTLSSFYAKAFFPLFEMVFENVLQDAYVSFKRNYPSMAYSNFAKTQKYYVNYVILRAFDYVKMHYDTLLDQFGDVLVLKEDNSFGYSDHQSFDSYKPGLGQELREYRSKRLNEIRHTNPKATNKEVFTDACLIRILQCLPKSDGELRLRCGFTPYQVQNFGNAVIKIVWKYCDVGEFKVND